MLKVNLRNEYPRCYVTRTIRGDAGFYFGPFVSRKAAESFSEGYLDLFKIRRCQIKIRRDPAFPGCMYSQMKMCLAPCFAGCTKEEYDAEVGRVLSGLDSGGVELIQGVEREREAASEALDFERAAALHKRLEKVSAALRGLPELARRVEEFDAVILQRAAEEKTIAVFPMRGGILREPIFLRFGELSGEPRSVEEILRAGLDSPESAGTDIAAEPGTGEKTVDSPEEQRSRFGLHAAYPDLTEHLSLLTRWFYSSPREGEIFFREADWPYRRLLRACSRLLAPPAGESPAGAGSRPARDRIRRLQAFSKAHRPPKK
jgi:excinuclease UvrABC nuclease subunit